MQGHRFKNNLDQFFFYTRKLIWFLFLLKDKFNSPGQNLGEESSSPNAPNTQDAIRGRIQSWFDENRDASMSDIRSFSSTNGAKYVLSLQINALQ